MPLGLPDLRTLRQEDVDQVQGETAERLQEAFPESDWKRGVLHDTVLHLHAILFAAFGDLVARKERSDSLLGIEEDPAIADPAVVDRVLSNFLVTRSPGASARGQVTIVVNKLAPTTIPAGAIFSANGVEFATEAAYAARESAAQVASTTDRVLRPIGDGLYVFTVPVVAKTAGTGGLLRRGTALAPSQRVPNLFRAYAEGNFSGGFDPESNADLLGRLQRGVAAKAWSNRMTIDAMVHERDDFANILQTSVIGFGDPEMHRDQHTAFPISTGGRCDLYARTQTVPASITLLKTCTLIQKTAEGGVWQFSIGRDEAPGFYRVERIGPPGSPQDTAGLELLSDVRDFDTTGPGWFPDIKTPEEAAYSRYQTATITFVDNDRDYAGLSVNVATAAYDVSVSYMPQIAELQLAIGGREVRGPASDVLVKAPIPCFTTVSFDIRQRKSAQTPDLAAIAEAVAQAVNGTGFDGSLHASMIADVVQDLIPKGSYMSGVDLFGRIRRPDGTTSYIHSAELIEIPNEPGSMVSARTTAFLLDPQDVGVTIKIVDMPET